MKWTMAVDPGLNGAICVFKDDEMLISDMPTRTVKVNGKFKRRIEIPKLAQIIDSYTLKGIERCFIENPQATGQMGTVSAFNFGFSCGVAQAIVAAHFIPTILVSPVKWKRDLELTYDKSICRKKADELFPNHKKYWLRAMDDGRAEAALIGHWGINHYVAA